MASLSEVWGDDMIPSSPPAPSQSPDNTSNQTITTKKKRMIESFAVPNEIPVKPPKHNGLALFMALIVTGACSIYAIDMFATSIR